MDITKFREKDLEQALREHLCGIDLIKRIESSFWKEDYQEFKLAIRNLQNTIKEIERLQQRKIKYDQLQDIVMDLRGRGFQVDIASRMVSY
jgi:hypothetical protein